MNLIDADTMTRATRLCEMMNEFITQMPPWKRDRMMQIHLAQARGPMENARLLAAMTNAMIQLRSAELSRPSASRLEQSEGADG